MMVGPFDYLGVLLALILSLGAAWGFIDFTRVAAGAIVLRRAKRAEAARRSAAEAV